MLTNICKGCKAIIPYPSAYCSNCKAPDKKESDKRYNKYKRNKLRDKFYHSPEWKKLSKLVLIRSSYICSVCGEIANYGNI